MRGIFRKLLSVSVVVALGLGATQSFAADNAARKAVEVQNKLFIAAAVKGDGAALAALYATDGQLLPPFSAAVTGRAEIQKFWQGALNSGVKGITLTSLEVTGHGATIDEVGQYSLLGDAGKVLETGKYIVIWKREQGKLKYYRDIWNSSTPLPPAKTP